MSKKALERPKTIRNKEAHFDAFESGKVLFEKKKNHLPAMGWNSWNAFGSGNTEELTKKMADCMVELGLDKLGYSYVVLDDGCYKSKREKGKLSHENIKFPGDFKALSDYIHGRGLKFGMYNDIGTNLCAGAAVGTCGHERTDARSYVDWGVDFLKVDNCYYLWDNATFSNPTNAKYVYAPNIRGLRLQGEGFEQQYSAIKDGKLTGCGGETKEDYVTNLGTFDGTGPGPSPVGDLSAELVFEVSVPQKGIYNLFVTYATGEEPGVGSWLQVAAGKPGKTVLAYDDFLETTESKEAFRESMAIALKLKKGINQIRLMNHRRQENTLDSYATLLDGLNKAKPGHDIILSICEWGKTQPQNWGKKVGDSWRILNDITFCVGSDGDPGLANWKSDYTTGVTSQYNKAVIMDEFAGLDKGWNDPDMLMIGMNGIDKTMNRTHFAMWCMMNSPLMLGMDLRRVKQGDWMHKIISNKGLIDLNQDALGVQAKRIYCSKALENPDKEYVTDIDRVDVLAKPLSDGSVALSFINCSEEEKEGVAVSVSDILGKIGGKMIDADAFGNAGEYRIIDLWTGKEKKVSKKTFKCSKLKACDNHTWKVTPIA